MDRRYLLQVLFFISLFACGHLLGCPCPAVYDPVCGMNGRTYGNSCEANCVNIPIRCWGKCPCTNCPCPKIYDPVCGIDGRTYSNPCLAHCNGIYFYRYGKCSNRTREYFSQMEMTPLPVNGCKT